ncbi:MAG: hypothetical protein K2J71_00875 [Oscillospiraceae bacterium]|nr:hypothetical protein [Oscillospiraceae bacterium]
MNLEKLCALYDLHDSVVVKFSYCFEKRCAVCILNLGDWQDRNTCTIKFNDILFFKLESENADFAENELIALEVSSDETEYFKAFFSEGFMKPGKAIEIRCHDVEIELIS